jgi:hypothetical protein
MAIQDGSISLGTSLTVAQGGNFNSLQIPNSKQLNLTNGTANGQADRHYVLSSSVTFGAPLSLDLKGGTIKGRDDLNFDVVEIVSYQIVCHTSSTGNLIYGGGSNPVANIAGVLEPGAQVLYFTAGNGLPVVAGTGDILKIDASAGTVNFDIYLTGRSV